MNLLDYCKTERQREVIAAYQDSGSSTNAAKALGTSDRTIRKTVQRVKEYAAKKGYAPGHWEDGSAPGYTLQKVTLHRKGGEVVQTWERQHPEIADAREAFMQMMDGMRDDIPRLPKTKAPRLGRNASLYLNLIVFGDPHLDMLAYDRETGKSWDSGIAEDQHMEAMENLVERAPESETGILCILGDSLHRDGLKAMTPGSGNLVDVDGRLGRSYETATRLFRFMAQKMLQRHKNVVVVLIRGNHSETLELALRVTLEVAFENEPRITVLDNTCKHVPYTFGKNFLLMTHGDRLNDQRKADIAVGMFRELHGAAKFTHVLTGHVHHASQKEVSGALVETFQALPTPDAWHTESGYVSSDQSVSLLTYHKSGGIVGRLTEYPRIFMGDDAA